MSVIAGLARGIPLYTPGTDLRPTMEIVKNAVFNSLLEVVPEASVLDLFAGSGSLGIEALSRGASSCVFVEENRKACDAIRRNLEKTKLSGGWKNPLPVRLFTSFSQTRPTQSDRVSAISRRSYCPARGSGGR